MEEGYVVPGDGEPIKDVMLWLLKLRVDGVVWEVKVTVNKSEEIGTARG